MEIPRNIRQIGEIEKELHLYIEDYVSTFIEKIKRKNDTCVGIFLGKQTEADGLPCLFVRGAVIVRDYEIEDGRIVMTASSWNGVYEQAEACFQDVEICGWFLCSRDGSLTDIYNLKKSHTDNFKGNHQVLFLYDGEREEEAVYRFDSQGTHRLRGYYIYYERNEQMQEYMISLEPARKTEYALTQTARGASDQAARRFRALMEEKQGKEQESPERNGRESRKRPGDGGQGAGMSRFLRTVSVAALLCGAGFGLASWYRYDKMQGVREVLAVFAGNAEEKPEETQERKEEESGQAVISEVSGNVKPTESTAGTTTEAESQVTELPEEEKKQEETGTSAETAASETAVSEAPPESQAAGAEPLAPSYREYTVSSGDTLNKICKKVYGNSESTLIEEVCRLNGMDNADFIYEGQTLKLPEN